MPQANKITKVETITESLKKAKGVVITDYSGLTVEQMTQLRREFRTGGYTVRRVGSREQVRPEQPTLEDAFIAFIQAQRREQGENGGDIRG